MDRELLKKTVAKYAIQYVIDSDIIIGVGTGSTIKYFIEELAIIKFKAILVSSSNSTTELLKYYGFMVEELNNVDKIDIYIDGADEVNNRLQLIKGGGGALTREKIIATMAKQFICIADESKQTMILGKHFPIPIEVIPMARSYVARQLVKLGAMPSWRKNFTTDNYNHIIDTYNLNTSNIDTLEDQINKIPGVVENGIFAARRADVILLSKRDGNVQVITN